MNDAQGQSSDEVAMPTAAADDTEITLGTGKLLALFFGLVTLCAVFFALGFSFGRNSIAKMSVAEVASSAAATSSGVRPSAIKNTSAAADTVAPVQPATNKPDDQAAKDTAASTPSPATSAPVPAASTGNAPADPAAAPVLNGYYVQVAAVTKQEDADALVDALKKKQYPAFSANSAPDKLFHVQVGPYADVKDAESMRVKLVGDGYNPILKK